MERKTDVGCWTNLRYLEFFIQAHETYKPKNATIVRRESPSSATSSSCYLERRLKKLLKGQGGKETGTVDSLLKLLKKHWRMQRGRDGGHKSNGLVTDLGVFLKLFAGPAEMWRPAIVKFNPTSAESTQENRARRKLAIYIRRSGNMEMMVWKEHVKMAIAYIHMYIYFARSRRMKIVHARKALTSSNIENWKFDPPPSSPKENRTYATTRNKLDFIRLRKGETYITTFPPLLPPSPAPPTPSPRSNGSNSLKVSSFVDEDLSRDHIQSNAISSQSLIRQL
ncbi:hypothetical protein YC2023_055008 [Brassica napus]